MAYWLNLFTGRTWREFQDAGAKVSGFREKNWERARKIKKGDVFLCYLVGVSRWVGLLEVESERFRDESRIYTEEVFPVRFRVKPHVMLTPEHGVPMDEFQGRLSFMQEGSPHWSGRVRSSPTKYDDADGTVIAEAIRQAAAAPKHRPVDPRLLERSSNVYRLWKKVKLASGVHLDAVGTSEQPLGAGRGRW